MKSPFKSNAYFASSESVRDDSISSPSPVLKAPLKGVGIVGMKNSGFVGGPKFSMDSMSKGKKAPLFGDLKSKTGGILPPPPLSSLKTGPGLSQGLPFTKKSTGSQTGIGIGTLKMPMKGQNDSPVGGGPEKGYKPHGNW